MPKQEVPTVPLTKARHLHHPEDEDAIISRLDAEADTRRLFESDFLTGRDKAVLALSNGVLPKGNGLKEAVIEHPEGPKTFADIANSEPVARTGSLRLPYETIGEAVGVHYTRAAQIDKHARERGKFILSSSPGRSLKMNPLRK